MPQTLKQDTQLLEAALIGYQRMREDIEQKIADLQSQIGNGSGHISASAHLSSSDRRTMSASARRRIAQAQRKRWAAVKSSDNKNSARTQPKKRTLSAAGRARIIAATKKRWAEFRKNQQSHAA